MSRDENSIRNALINTVKISTSMQLTIIYKIASSALIISICFSLVLMMQYKENGREVFEEWNEYLEGAYITIWKVFKTKLLVKYLPI